jgi:hypothetical protein
MLPLAGVRILAVEVYGAGPFGTTHLADLGAEVIKIEPREGGDVSRAVGPFFLGEDDSVFFQSLNRNKKSLTLDLKHPEGREVLEKLAKTADGLLSNLRGDQPEKLRITYKDLAGANPRIVCAHLSAYGRDGSRKSWPGYDYLMQGEAGWPRSPGEPDGRPRAWGLSVVDYSTGTTCALALLAGILEARRTGQGARPRRIALRRRHAPAQLPGGLVPEREAGDGPRAALGAPVHRALAALSHAGRLALRHGADAAFLGSARGCARPWRAQGEVPELRIAARASRGAD